MLKTLTFFLSVVARTVQPLSSGLMAETFSGRKFPDLLEFRLFSRKFLPFKIQISRKFCHETTKSSLTRNSFP